MEQYRIYILDEDAQILRGSWGNFADNRSAFAAARAMLTMGQTAEVSTIDGPLHLVTSPEADYLLLH